MESYPDARVQVSYSHSVFFTRGPEISRMLGIWGLWTFSSGTYLLPRAGRYVQFEMFYEKNTVILLWALLFLPTIPLPGKGIPPRKGDNYYEQMPQA